MKQSSRYRIAALVCLMAVSCVNAFAVSRTVKAAGGGDCTVIQTCVNLMAAGDTTTVFAGTYAESVTVTAGTVGNLKTITVNTGDVVSVLRFTINSHVKVNGFTITNPSSPTTVCVSTPASTTDFYITNNIITACGGITLSQTVDHGFVQGNTISYMFCTPGALNTGPGFAFSANNMLVENNDISHVSDGFHFQGSHNVLRKNTMHDTIASECGTNSGNCHIDFVESEPNVAGGGIATQFNMYEGNTLVNNVSANGHGYLSQGDTCSGSCSNLIIRYNIGAHVGGGGILDDNAASAVNPGYFNVKGYNNTWADFMSAGTTFGSQNTFNHNSTGGAQINELFYYPSAITDSNSYSTDASTVASFAVKNNLAWCTSGGCSGLHGKTYGSGTFTSDPGNFISDPLFVNYASNDFHLQSGSPARSAGTSLTTANGSGSTSTALTATDAGFFQDGSGITGVQADWIRIGASTTVQISSINYSTNVITLASAVTWSNADPIYLYKDSSGNVVLNGASPDIGALQFTGQVSTPTFSPVAGTYATTQTVTITSVTASATICYTTDGTSPTANGAGTCTHGTTLANGGTVSVASSVTVQALGTLSGSTDSGIGSATYTIGTPVASLTPSSLSFGGINISNSSASQTLTLQNTGTAVMSITSISLTGANTGDFFQSNNCPVGSNLGNGASCTITVTFTPLAVGARAASVSVTDGASGSPHASTLSGTGVQPLISGQMNPGARMSGRAVLK